MGTGRQLAARRRAAVDARLTGRAATYVLPLRWERDWGVDELSGYLRWLTEAVDDVIVVDGSPAARFDVHRRAFPGAVRHVAPDPELRFAMGKVDGVLTGVALARREHVVIADDDVRWDAAALDRAIALLDRCDLVRPQNHFEPLVWHARLDTARTLINRGFSGDLELGAGDFPGTLLVRRSILRRTGGYDGDVLFENLELIRTVAAAGGRVETPLDLYVRRLPPDTRHFLAQRVRQAYDDFALPLRMTAWLAIAPAIVAAPRRAALGVAAGSIGLAEVGRRRGGGMAVFPLSSSLLAPLWVAERAVCAWVAVGQRLRHGGTPYAGGRIARAATPTRVLRARYAARSTGSGLSASPSAAPSA